MESVLEEWKVRSKNLLKNVINRGKSVLQKRRVYEIAILLGDTLFMCTMQEGRFVKQKEYRLKTVDETSLEEVFCRAKKDGFTNNYLWWIATTSSEKIKIRKYPYMTEEELYNNINDSKPVMVWLGEKYDPKKETPKVWKDRLR